MSSKKKNERRLEIIIFSIMGLTAVCCVVLISFLSFGSGRGMAATAQTLSNETESRTEADTAEQTAQTPSSSADVVKIDVSLAETTEAVTETAPQYSSQETQTSVDEAWSSQSNETAESAIITKYVFVGDSRYVGMSVYAQADDVFIAKVGEGYSYLTQQLSNIRAACNSSSTALIIGLGVNDLSVDYSQSYISTINQLAAELPCRVFYMLVNPVDENAELSAGYHVTNSAIDAFNLKMCAGLSASVNVIDTNSFLKSDGFTSVDGIHYDNSTYYKIYFYIRNYVYYS